MKTIAEQLNIKNFPFEIKDSNGNLIYYENSTGYWFKNEYDINNGKEIYFETSKGYWTKRKYDINNGKEIYFEDSNGILFDYRSKKIVLTMDDIADKFNINVKDLKVKK